MRAALLMLLLANGALAGPAREVDPFIGTGGHGHTYPGATMPFGMVQLSPDTRLTGWDGCSGYHDSDRTVHGFSHTHLSGTGVSDYGDILLRPFVEDIEWEAGPASFNKRSERAFAGYYRVLLSRPRIEVELTATPRSGVHRYHFAGDEAGVLIDLLHRDELLESSLRISDEYTVEGMRRSRAWALDQHVHFVARFSQPILRHELQAEERAKLWFGDVDELVVQLAISAVDVEGARRNLEAEWVDFDFDQAQARAESAWDESLGRIGIEGASREQRTIFTTALYHSLIAPNLFSDVDSRYRGMDHAIHVAEDRDHYTVFSLWDTFRATHPLFTLLEPERTVDLIETMLAQYEQSGRLPVWELAANETNCMIGYHSVSVIADAWAKGIHGFDAERALEAMVATANADLFGLDVYRTQGFLTADDESESVSKTLEYAYDDWCIARFAASLGRTEIAEEFYRRSMAWLHLLDPQTDFFRPRQGQRWFAPFDPFQVNNHYTEANAWQYSMFVPQDIQGLIGELGGDERFLERLRELFEANSHTTGRDQADITGLIGQYAHGNEPSHHMAWLAHHAGNPEQSVRRVRRILDELYDDEPDGLSGNEDCGQMSSWYVWSSLGLYPVTPGADELVVGLPLFRRATIDLPSGGRLVIEREGRGRSIESVQWNGAPLSKSWLPQSELAKGGVLRIQSSRRASTSWGRAPEDRPGSFADRESSSEVLPAPFVGSGAAVFRDSTLVELIGASSEGSLHYSTDGSNWNCYEAPLLLRDSEEVRFFARSWGPGGSTRNSPTVTARFHRIPNDWQIECRSEPRPQYTAGGPVSLVDGLRGSVDWRTGAWQGYQYADLDATVDLGEVRTIVRAGASFLQDVRSWIWMPSEMVVSISLDGHEFREVGRARPSFAPDDYELSIEELEVPVGVDARYLRVQAINRGPIPEWHPGFGDECFIFVDEILID